jgi:hypothetical protein
MLLGRRLQQMLDALQGRPEHQPGVGEPAPWHPAHLGGQAPSVPVARVEESVPRCSISPTWRRGVAPAGAA